MSREESTAENGLLITLPSFLEAEQETTKSRTLTKRVMRIMVTAYHSSSYSSSGTGEPCGSMFAPPNSCFIAPVVTCSSLEAA